MTPAKARYPIRKAQYDAFWADGFLVIPELIESSLVQMLHHDYVRATAGEFGDLKWGNSAKMGQQVQKPVHRGAIPGWDKHPYRLNGQSACEQLMGVDLVFRYGQMIRKPAHYPARVQWHQDGRYWQDGKNSINGYRGCTCWVALSEAFPGNGSVMYIVGSHHLGLLEHTDQSAIFEFDNAREAQGFDPSKAVAVTMHPGDAVIHHPLTVHGSGGNETAVVREGLTSHLFVANEVWVARSNRGLREMSFGLRVRGWPHREATIQDRDDGVGREEGRRIWPRRRASGHNTHTGGVVTIRERVGVSKGPPDLFGPANSSREKNKKTSGYFSSRTFLAH